MSEFCQGHMEPNGPPGESETHCITTMEVVFTPCEEGGSLVGNPQRWVIINKEGSLGGPRASWMLRPMHCWPQQERRMLRLRNAKNQVTPAAKSHLVLPLGDCVAHDLHIFRQRKEYVLLKTYPRRKSLGF